MAKGGSAGRSLAQRTEDDRESASGAGSRPRGPDRRRSPRCATGRPPTVPRPLDAESGPSPPGRPGRDVRVRSAVRPPAASPDAGADHAGVTPPVVPTDPAASASHVPGLFAPRSRGRSTALIGQIVVELGFATEEAVEAAVNHARETGRLTGRVLIEDGVLTPTQLARVLAERFGVERVDLAVFAVEPAMANLVDPGFVRRHDAIPIGKDPEGQLLLAMADPANVLAIDDVTMLTGMRCARSSPPTTTSSASPRARQRLPGARRGTRTSSRARGRPRRRPRRRRHRHRDSTDDAPIIKLVNSVLKRAIRRGASDIHFDPGSRTCGSSSASTACSTTPSRSRAACRPAWSRA